MPLCPEFQRSLFLCRKYHFLISFHFHNCLNSQDINHQNCWSKICKKNQKIVGVCEIMIIFAIRDLRHRGCKLL